MSLPNIDTLTPDQLRALLSLASSRLVQIEQDQAQTEADLRTSIADTREDLVALIGDGDSKGFNSIMGVRQHTGEEMVAAAATLLPVIIHGLELLARAQLEVALVVGD